jgi:hypothetical protein
VLWSAYFITDCGLVFALYIVPTACKLYLLIVR